MNDRNNQKAKQTSWNTVSKWYDDLLKKDPDSYQAQVITPNLNRFLNLKKDEKVLDLACGQGYFANIFYQSGATIVASDISRNLIEIAREHSPKGISYYVNPAHKINFVNKESLDTVVIVLAIQNIENIADVFAECNRVLKKGGRVVIVLNHPTFRIPQTSDWSFVDGIQSRTVAKYLSGHKIDIDMTPGEKNVKKKIKTISFHRSLQDYMKVFFKNGFAVTRLEEWISHKKSGTGPRQNAEDMARKEIPLFMCMEIKKM